MELFKTNKVLLTLLLIYPIDKNKKLAWKYLNILLVSFMIGIGVISVVASISYAIQNINNLAEILYAIFLIISLCCSNLLFLTGLRMARRFIGLIKRFQDIYDTSEKPQFWTKF